MGTSDEQGDTPYLDPDKVAANRKLVSHPEKSVIALAQRGAELGIVFHIEGFPFGGRKA